MRLTNFFVVISTILISIINASTIVSRDIPPSGYERVAKETTYDWCDCGEEGNVTISESSVAPNTTVFIHFDEPKDIVTWSCNNGKSIQRTKMSESYEWWSLQVTTEKKTCGFSEKTTSRLRWNAWKPSNETVSTPFVSKQNGYACLKIPVLLQTDQDTLLAFAEARRENCSDFAHTDLLFRRSVDHGKTWSKIQSLYESSTSTFSGICGNALVVGNAAPVQLSSSSTYPNRILVPHTQNNFHVFQVHSDDDGLTWSDPRRIYNVTTTSKEPDCTRNLTYFGIDTASTTLSFLEDIIWNNYDPYEKFKSKLQGDWQFVGLGPPGSVALRENHNVVLVPGYHSYIRGLVAGGGSGKGAGAGLPVSQLLNNVAFGHVMYSEDAGDTYRIPGGLESATRLGVGCNEAQIVQLLNGSLLLNTRTLSLGTPQFRAQSRSDDHGLTWTPTQFLDRVSEPFNGCEGSVASSKSGEMIYMTHPNSVENHGVVPEMVKHLLNGRVNLTGRDHMTLYESLNQGETYEIKHVIDSGASGYSSIQVDGTSLWILYEQSDESAQTAEEVGIEALIGSLSVLNPDRLVLKKFDV